MLPLTGSAILITVLGSILCKSLFSTDFKKSSDFMSSTFFMFPLANRINEPLVKLDIFGDVIGGGGSGVKLTRRCFFSGGSATMLLLMLWLLLLLLRTADTAGVVDGGGGGGGSILC